MTARPFDRLPLLCATALLAFTSASAQEAPLSNGQRITPNFKDANISTIIEAVSEATGKNFIVDPRVNAQVTMFSRTPMSPEAFYEAFLAILQVHGFVAVPAGNVVKIVPDANARQLPANDLPSRVSGSSDEIVTQVIAVRNVSAAQLVPILRPLIPQYGHLAAYPASNILIISDRAANVNRIVRIIGRIDQEGDADVEVVPLQNASAAEVVRIVTSLYQAQAAAEGGGASPLRLVADDRSNSVLVSGDSAQRLRIKALIAHLDTPLEAGGDTQVRYLNYADAEKIATKLKEQVTGIAQAAQPTGAQGAAPAGAAAADRSTTIWADAETNALVVTAQPKIMRQLMAVVDKLDIRRAQVLVEAIIVEVGENSNAELGVNWAVFSNEDDTRIPAGAFLNPVGGVTLADLARAVDNPSGTVNPNLASGTTIGIGRITDTGVNFAAMLRAIRGDANTNVLATPSAVTMDNQEAELKVAQEVPFVTGQFTATGQTTDGSVNPFQTIQREEVGTILKVTPQINEGDSVMLKIELESSSLATSSQGAVDLITNKRTITTHVLVEDGGVVVLGGLISNEARREEQRVPFLGRIPLIGLAFKTRTAASQRTNLMVFIRPKILRDGVQTTIETNQKYNYMREEQRKARGFELVPLLPRTDKPELPPAPPPKEGEADSTSQKPTEPADTPAPTTPPEGDQR
ncbi:MAG: type II secretion system secretin GspD [Gammaproteobacteria bacterium]